MNVVPLKFNPHSGGGFLTNYWWVILIVVIILVAGVIFAFSGSSNTGSSVSLSKKIVDGEEVYVKVVNGEEVPLTAEDHKKISGAEKEASDAIESTKNISTDALQKAAEAQELSKQALDQAMAASNASTVVQ